MDDTKALDNQTEGPWFPGWRTLTVVLILYTIALTIATYPRVLSLQTHLPSQVDPVAHIYTMRWYRTCLLEGRSPFRCPDLQYPVGAPLGNLPPLQFQSLLFVPLSLVIDNDILCYNIIWISSFLLTGMGTFLLAWQMVRDRGCAFVAGLTVMIGGSMLSFAHSELEQITVGWFPLFVLAWMHFVDHPTRRRLLGAVGTYLLLAMSAPYFVVFGVFPATLYVVWQAVGAWRQGDWTWLRSRLAWFVVFVALTLPGLLLLFANQLWAITNGYALTRSRGEFDLFGAAFQGYLLPTPLHPLGRLLSGHWTLQARFPGQIMPYLGVVTLALLLYALGKRVTLKQAGFWWTTLVVLVVLSLGSNCEIGTHRVGLPAGWLRDHFLPFHLIRVPARFCLFASVCASILMAAGLKHLLGRLPDRRWRAAVLVAVTVLAVADLAMVPYLNMELPEMPACYAWVRQRDPAATFHDIPQAPHSAANYHLAAACAYWQSRHEGRTSAGYTAFPNTIYDDLMSWNSPFSAFKLADANYLANSQHESYDVLRDVSFDDYAWIYLKVHGLRYVVLHQSPMRVSRTRGAS